MTETRSFKKNNMLTRGSTIMMLQEYCFPKSAPGSLTNGDANFDNEFFPEARSALDAICTMAVKVRARIIANPGLVDDVSIFLTQMVYRAGSTLIRLGGGDPDESIRQNIDAQKDLLHQLSTRWHEAGEYLLIASHESRTILITFKGVFLSILEAQEVMMASTTL